MIKRGIDIMCTYKYATKWHVNVFCIKVNSYFFKFPCDEICKNAIKTEHKNSITKLHIRHAKDERNLKGLLYIVTGNIA